MAAKKPVNVGPRLSRNKHGRLPVNSSALLLFHMVIGIQVLAGAGDWPEQRQNAQLTAIQPLSGCMGAEPVVIASYDLGRSRPVSVPVAAADGSGHWALCIASGALSCYRQNGECLWTSHPAGINFTSVVATGDFNGNGRNEVLLQAGRPTEPFGAAVLLSLEDGRLLWRHDIGPMSYSYTLHAGKFLPDTDSRQIIVLMQGYPPDARNGHIALFGFDGSGDIPALKWRYDFDQYTCFPSLLTSDLDADGIREIVVQTHSRMWFLDAVSGRVRHFAQWDVAPANVRSYGLVRFVDLDLDGREDFLCIANFAQHHEVLLNRNGVMEKAWHHGWPESVTTGKVATTWPEPPYADMDGDGAMEVVVSIFNAEDDRAWVTRAYDAVTGGIKCRAPGMVAESILEGGEVLANACDDPTQTAFDGACLLAPHGDRLVPVWEDRAARAVPPKGGSRGLIERAGKTSAININAEGQVIEEPWAPSAPQNPDFSALPETMGPVFPVMLASDLTGDGSNELVLCQEPSVIVLDLKENRMEKTGVYASDAPPVLADLNGDGALEIVLSTVRPDSVPVVEALTPSRGNGTLWRTQFPASERQGLPQARKAYLRAGRFTGKATPDIYVWAGTPLVRSAVLNGCTGAVLWEKGEVPGLERYWGPSVNMASVVDYNGDGSQDLVFTNPDYFCVASGPTGEALLGPLFPPDIFNQPSQGLYTMPVLLENTPEAPTVCLVSGHYFHGVMTLDGKAKWYRIPEVGLHATGREGFLRLSDGRWTMGFGRQNGLFACVNVEDGSTRWELPLEAAASDVIVCDMDGDGQGEFVFGTSHGHLFAVKDAGNAPFVLWKKQFSAQVGPPVAADLNGDGRSEIALCTADGWLHVLGGQHE